jgi:hypothetical protein
VARAIAEANGGQVALALSGKYCSLASLLRLQPYVSEVYVCADWQPEEYAVMTPMYPPTLPAGDWAVVSLAYRGWPDQPLPQYLWSQVQTGEGMAIAPLALERPWIETSESRRRRQISVGFSDEWFELKYGLVELLRPHWMSYCSLSGYSVGRWTVEGGRMAKTWERQARDLAGSRVCLACNSALHVLACAVGTPVVMMEPSEARWNPIFYPYGMDGPRVTLVRGNDGRPTFDARHVADALRKALDR